MESSSRSPLVVEAIVLGFLAVWLGIFSMGFQLLGSRMLGAWFGSSIIVWAFLISTFLAAFSIGSLLGGFLARKDRPGVALTSVVLMSIAGFAVNAAAGQTILGWLDGLGMEVEPTLLIACLLLFFLPVCGLASLTPLMVQRLARVGQEAGFASGWIYSVSTIGNIAGIMLTAFVLIPRAPVSAMLWVWTVGVAAGTAVLLVWLRR